MRQLSHLATITWCWKLTFNTSLIRGDRGTLNTDIVLLDGFGSINGNLIVGLQVQQWCIMSMACRCDMSMMIAYSVTVLNAKVVVLDVKIQVWEDELFLDELPNDSGHLITIEVDNGVLDVDFAGSHCYVCKMKRVKKRVRKEKREMPRRSALYINLTKLVGGERTMMTEAVSQMTDWNLAAADVRWASQGFTNSKGNFLSNPAFPGWQTRWWPFSLAPIQKGFTYAGAIGGYTNSRWPSQTTLSFLIKVLTLMPMPAHRRMNPLSLSMFLVTFIGAHVVLGYLAVLSRFVLW